MKTYRYPIVLTIAGSDSGGGAGIQADLKTISALGCYGASAITAVTVQNTVGVFGIHYIPIEVVTGQIKAIMDDIHPSAIKIGMVHSAQLAVAIATVLKEYPSIPVIFDPVMVSTSGTRLTENNTMEVFKNELFPMAQLVTPNLDEAGLLSGMMLHTTGDMKEAAVRILKTGCNAVLVKGGHLKGPDLYDVFLDKQGFERIYNSPTIDTGNTHGTGCTLSSAIAAFVALGNDLCNAIEKAEAYLHEAVEAGKEVKIGEGHGPLNHFYDPKKMVKWETG